jgi:hypothetical protein
MSQRKAAKALGVGEATIRRDMRNNGRNKADLTFSAAPLLPRRCTALQAMSTPTNPCFFPPHGRRVRVLLLIRSGERPERKE